MKNNNPILRGTITHEAYPDSRNDGELTNNKVLTTDSSGNLEVRTLPPVEATTPPIYRGNDITLDATYHGKTVIMSGEFDQVVTVPLEATESIPIGFTTTIIWRRQGKVTITPEGGVTVLKDINEDLIIQRENEAITLRKEDTDEWGIYGSLNQTGITLPDWTYDDMQEVLDPATQTTINTLAWSNVHKSSDWSEFTTTQDYFIIYATDHHSVPGGVWWGEMDDLYFTNFNERGKLIDNGFTFEMCYLFRVSSGESTLTTDEIWIIGHDIGNPVQNFGVNGNQQTRLFTTAGGSAIHTCTWADRGNILGYNTTYDPQHTGYATIYKKGTNDWVCSHFYGSSVNGTDWSTTHVDWWVSTASDPAGPWTQQHAIFGTHPSLAPSAFPQAMGMKQINYKGVDYIVGMVEGTRIAVFDTWDAWLQPETLVCKSQLIDGFSSWQFYYPTTGGNYIWLYTKNGDPVTNPDRPFRVYKYDLREILG